MKKITKSEIDQLTYEIIGSAIKIHKQLGPGLLESVYHECMKIELEIRGIPFQTELQVPVYYEENEIDTVLRCDLFVDDTIVVELKSVKKLEPIFDAQLLTYMKLLEAPKGILINFNCVNVFHDGQKTFVNRYFELLEE